MYVVLFCDVSVLKSLQGFTCVIPCLKLVKSPLVGSGMGWLGLWRCLPSSNFAGHRCGICF